MKSLRSVFSVLLGFALAGAASAFAADEPTCRTLLPDSLAWANVRSARQVVQPACGPRLAAAKVEETVLDKIDVMLVFDASAQTWLAGEGTTVAAFATNAIVRMNECLTNSLIDDFSFRLAEALPVDEDLSGTPIITILTNRLVNAYGDFIGAGALKSIADRRAASGADLVVFLYDGPTQGTIGISYQLQPDSGSWDDSDIPLFADWAYGVCSIRMVATGRTLAHECGHMMGCGHPDETVADARYVSVGPQYYPYSSGYYFWVGDKGYFTVMGYPAAGKVVGYRYTEAPYFSSPDVTTPDGVAVGSPIHDNRKTLLNTYRYVAQYAVSRQQGGETPDPKPDDPEPEPEPEDDPEETLGRFMGDVTYNGYVTDGTGAVRGTFVIAAGKGSKKAPYTSKLSVKYTPRGGKQKSLTLANDAMPVTNTFATVTLPELGTVRLYRDMVVDDTGSVWGCRDYLKDKFYKTSATKLLSTLASTKTFVADSEDLGFSTFSMNIDKKGKGKLSGALLDGTKVSVNAQGILTANALYLPVVFAKGAASFSFLMTVKMDVDRTATISAASPLTLASGTCAWHFTKPSENCALADGIHRLSLPMDEVKYALGGTLLETADGFDLTPTGLVFSVKGKTWNAGKTVGKVAVDKTTKKPCVTVKAGKIPENLPSLKFTYTPKTGAVKGSFNMFTWNGTKVGTVKVSFSGLVTNGKAWCVATSKKPSFDFDLTITDGPVQ